MFTWPVSCSTVAHLWTRMWKCASVCVCVPHFLVHGWWLVVVKGGKDSEVWRRQQLLIQCFNA